MFWDGRLALRFCGKARLSVVAVDGERVQDQFDSKQQHMMLDIIKRTSNEERAEYHFYGGGKREQREGRLSANRMECLVYLSGGLA